MQYENNQELEIKAKLKITGIFPAGDVHHKVTTYKVEIDGHYFNIPEPLLEKLEVKSEPEEVEEISEESQEDETTEEESEPEDNTEKDLLIKEAKELGIAGNLYGMRPDTLIAKIKKAKEPKEVE